MKELKLAIYVSGGIVQGIRSNITDYIDIEIVDEDIVVDEGVDKQEAAEDRWEELQTELPFGNY